MNEKRTALVFYGGPRSHAPSRNEAGTPEKTPPSPHFPAFAMQVRRLRRPTLGAVAAMGAAVHPARSLDPIRKGESA